MAFCADHDRRAYGPGSARLEQAFARLVVTTIEVDLAGLQECGDDLDRFLEPGVAVVVGITEGVVLHLVVSRADPQNQAPTADLIDGVGHLGQQRRVAETHAQHQITELDRPGAGGQGRQHRPGFPVAVRLGRASHVVEKMVVEPDGIEANLLGQHRDVSELRPTEARAVTRRQIQPHLEPVLRGAHVSPPHAS